MINHRDKIDSWPRRGRGIAMTAEDYDTWYRSSRRAWIGETEYRSLWAMLGAEPGQTLLDVGCGTGYFSRRFAADGVAVTGIDPDATWWGSLQPTGWAASAIWTAMASRWWR